MLSTRCNAVRNQSRSTMLGSSRKRIGILSFAAVLSGFAFLTVGCDQLTGTSGNNRYELKQDSAGRTIRLDKQTGDIALVEAGKVTPIPSEVQLRQEQLVQQARIAALSAPKFFPPLPMEAIGGKTATVSTMWRDGKLHFQLVFIPPPRRSSQSFGIGLSAFRVSFYDANGFAIAEEPIPTQELAYISDEKGHVIINMTANWAFPLSQDAYESITGWNLNWLY